eukprot:scaffold44843_cov30-Phaeocystis_antarctica.AAC.1
MGHISDGSKWPSKQLELLRQQEKSEAALAALRVQCEVDLAVSAAKQEEQAYAELARDERNLDRGAARGIRF